jgi:hypothetical protein
MDHSMEDRRIADVSNTLALKNGHWIIFIGTVYYFFNDAITLLTKNPVRNNRYLIDIIHGFRT